MRKFALDMTKTKNSPRYFGALLAMLVMALLWIAGAGDAQARSPRGRDSTQRRTAATYGFDDLSAQSWLLVEASTGSELSSKSPDSIMYPASMTKIMTCLVAIESGHLRDTITIGADASRIISTTVHAGDRFILRNLLDEMMLESDNGAARAIADHLSRYGNFIEKMNRRARQLGMTNTHFANPHGLHDTQNYTTARDLMKLVRCAMQDTTFAAIVGNFQKDVPLVYPAGKVMHCKSTNKLLSRYEGANGIKTGYVRAAGGCLASAAKRGGIQLYLVVMKCSPVRARFDESAFLLNYGFEKARLLPISDSDRRTVPHPRVRRPSHLNTEVPPPPPRGKRRR